MCPAVESWFTVCIITVHIRLSALNSNLNQDHLDHFLQFCSLDLVLVMFLAALKLIGM